MVFENKLCSEKGKAEKLQQITIQLQHYVHKIYLMFNFIYSFEYIKWYKKENSLITGQTDIFNKKYGIGIQKQITGKNFQVGEILYFKS